MPHSLRTFGYPALTDGSGELKLNAKELALLVYLRVTGQPQGRGAIGELLWANIRIGQNNSVNTALSALRRHLSAEVVPAATDPVALGGDLPCDVDVLLRAAGGGEGELRAALGVYRAPFLEGFEFQLGEGAERFVRWVVERRAAYEAALVQSLEEHCGREAAAGRWEAVRETAKAGREKIPGWAGGAAWIEEANRKLARRRTGRVGTAGLALCVVAALLVFGPRSSGAAAECRPGESRAHLIRQTYSAEANLAIRTGHRYTPTWYLKNVGTCSWARGARAVRTRVLRNAALSTGSGVRIVDRPVPPDSIVEIEVPVRGPSGSGSFGEDWILLDPSGRRIRLTGGDTLQVRLQVTAETLPRCRSGGIVAELLAQSHPGRDTRMRPGERFVSEWVLANRGTCMWDTTLALRFHSTSGRRLSSGSFGPVRMTQQIRPTEAYTFEVPMAAPAAEGSYRESWELTGADALAIPVSDAPTADVRIVVSATKQLRPVTPVCAPGREVVTWLVSERVMDGSVVAAGAAVPKAWTLFNYGDCTWAVGSLRLRHVRSEPEFAASRWREVVVGREVPPGAAYTFRAPFAAPTVPGHYLVHWSLYDRRGRAVRISRAWTLWADFHVSKPELDATGSSPVARSR